MPVNEAKQCAARNDTAISLELACQIHVEKEPTFDGGHLAALERPLEM